MKEIKIEINIRALRYEELDEKDRKLIDAYPSGTCAERTTLFYANSQYPDQAVDTLAIAARSETGYLDSPIPPCGACRQVLLETEQRFHQPMRILLYSKNDIYVLEGTKDLLPLSFGGEYLKV